MVSWMLCCLKIQTKMMEKMCHIAKRRWRKVILAESYGITVVGGYYLDLLLWRNVELRKNVRRRSISTPIAWNGVKAISNYLLLC